MLYTGLLALLTVGAVYFATHSGMYMLVLAGMGVLLVVLGGGTAGPTSAAGADHAEDVGAGLTVDGSDLWPHSYANGSVRVLLVLYGFGVFVWSLVVLLALRDTLV